MAGRYRTQHVAVAPRGWRVRTVARGAHRVRVAFPPGRRKKGSGKVVEILHPRNENPCRANPAELVLMGANPRTRPKFFVGEFAIPKKRSASKFAGSVTEIFTSRSGHHSYKLHDRRWFPESGLISGRVGGANPTGDDAAELFEQFHGKAATGETQYDEPHIPAQTLTELGQLVELKLLRPAGWKNALLNWTGRDVKLASNAQGTQLYAVGGDQKITRGEITRIGGDNSKDLVDLGEAISVVYRAKKSQTDFRAASWEHTFGEEGGQRPQVMYDRRIKRVQFVGGDYRIEAPGIIN